MIHRFIEAEDDHKSNHGKFLILRFGADDFRARSQLTGGPLLATLRPVRRFGVPITQTTLLLVDLQTQEGTFFDLDQDDATTRARFLCHPIHVCILYYPLMRFLSRNAGNIWKLPNLVTLPLDDVLDQPGVLLDGALNQVRTMREWSRRPPLVARLRNREVPIDPEEGQDRIEDAVRAAWAEGRLPGEDAVLARMAKAQTEYAHPPPCCDRPSVFETRVTVETMMIDAVKICRNCGAWRLDFHETWNAALLPPGSAYPEGGGFLIPPSSAPPVEQPATVREPSNPPERE